MRITLAILTLILANSAMAQSTSTKKLKIAKKKSFAEKINLSYFGELGKSVLSESITPGKNSSLYNSFTGSYAIDKNSNFTVSTRFSLVDSADENGKGDRFLESDSRVAYNRVLYQGETDRLKVFVTFELPTSKASQASDSEKITRFKPSILYTKKLDNYNSILLFGGYNKTINRKATASVGETSKYYLTEWFSYTNSKLSEKYVLRIDYEGAFNHVAGKNDLQLLQANTSERFAAGVNFNFAGSSMFAFLQHQPYLIKAIDQVGAGLQIFKSF